MKTEVREVPVGQVGAHLCPHEPKVGRSPVRQAMRRRRSSWA